MVIKLRNQVNGIRLKSPSNHLRMSMSKTLKVLFSKNKELTNLLVDLAYIELGLVPVSQYQRSEIGSLQKCLMSLDKDMRRKTTRKFRKMKRKSGIKNRKTLRKITNVDFQNSVYFHIIEKYAQIEVSDNDEC